MRVPDNVKQGAVFLGYMDDEGIEKLIGTGVMVGVEEGDVVFRYIVTADHLVRTMPGQLPGLSERKTAFARFFESNGDFIDVRLSNDIFYDGSQGGRSFEHSIWQKHPTDSGVDAAVAIIIPNTPWANRNPGPLALVFESLFVNEGNFGPNKLGLGDEVFVTGIFGYPGRDTLKSPIVRTGTLASIPNERIRVGKPFESMQCYLIESRSIGGLSGSPVFIRQTVSLSSDDEQIVWKDGARFGFGDFHFLGIMHGHWDVDVNDRDNVVPTSLSQAKGGVNVGIAIVTPAHKIREILYCPRYVQQRADFLTKI